MQQKRKIELLSPAKDVCIAKEAILHGADAVYIGGPDFGARAIARNEVKDIEELCHFAHLYNASVYVALNTIIKDGELHKVEELVWELYFVGVDALIVQDVGILSLHLPPIALHASTQMDNRTLRKVQFLEQTGFSQVVLAREMTLEGIREIAQNTHITLEAFIHGALCVCRSGACYASEYLYNRSANRGECAQCCRLPYDLVDGNDEVIVKNSHLLSLKDLNLSSHLESLIDAGVSSFKIEGRLKGMDYVKNITAYYRTQIDKILRQRNDLTRSSLGDEHYTFTPNPYKSFNRGFTSYYISGRRDEDITSFHTPKSIGEKIGKVGKTNKDESIRVETQNSLHNGDGFCFVDRNGEFKGFRVNKANGSLIYLPEKVSLSKETILYRNYDAEFQKQLNKPSAERKIPIKISFSSLPNGYTLSFDGGRGLFLMLNFYEEKQVAHTSQRAMITEQLQKLGGTPLKVSQIEIHFDKEYFIPSSKLNLWKRLCVEKFLSLCRLHHRPKYRPKEVPIVPWGEESLDYRANVINQNAHNFYHLRGVESIEEGFELSHKKDVVLMTTKHCLRHSLGYCPKQKDGKKIFKAPWRLLHGKDSFYLYFDCKNCEMQVLSKPM